MTDSDKLLSAQKLIQDRLAAHRGPILIPDWGRNPADPRRKSFRLTLWAAGRTSGHTFRFSRKELLAGYGSKGWEERLRRRVREMLRAVRSGTGE